MVKKSKLRKPKKEDGTLKKVKTSQGVRQNVNVVVNLAQRRRPAARAKKQMRMRGIGEPLLPSSITATTPPRRTPVEIRTSNNITQERLKEIQDEARSESAVKLLEAERKVLLLQNNAREQQEAQEDRINKQTEIFQKGLAEIREEGMRAFTQINPLKKNPNIRGVSTGRKAMTAEQRLASGIQKFKATGKIQRGRTPEEKARIIEMAKSENPLQGTPQKNEPRGMAFDTPSSMDDEERSQDGN